MENEDAEAEDESDVGDQLERHDGVCDDDGDGDRDAYDDVDDGGGGDNGCGYGDEW